MRKRSVKRLWRFVLKVSRANWMEDEYKEKVEDIQQTRDAVY